mgnify:CR=1 FL=1
MKNSIITFLLITSISSFSQKIITKKIEDFYKIKNELEKKIDTFSYSAIEWRALNYIDLNKEQSGKILEILGALEELDDVQNIFTNANLEI